MTIVLSTTTVLTTSGLQAQDPDWATMPYTTHEAYQAVDANGGGTFPTYDPVRMQGVILNRPQDMLDGTPGSNPFMGGQWQIQVQAWEAGDFGGTMLWMGQNIGKISGTHPSGSYTDAEWLAEVDRLNHDPATGRAFRPGDIVEVRARAPGLFFNGKTNINEQHDNHPLSDFDVVLLAAWQGLPEPATVVLSAVKDATPGPAFDTFLFDSTRASGAEHYQGSAIRIENVAFVDATAWGPDATLTITDGTLTLPVKLGRNEGFTQHPAPAGPFDIVGIFDQEDGVTTDGWKAGYRLWVMAYDGTRFHLPGQELSPADFDGDGDADHDDFAHLQRCFTAVGQDAEPICRDADLNRDLAVDDADVLLFEQCASGPAMAAEADCLELLE